LCNILVPPFVFDDRSARLPEVSEMSDFDPDKEEAILLAGYNELETSEAVRARVEAREAAYQAAPLRAKAKPTVKTNRFPFDTLHKELRYLAQNGATSIGSLPEMIAVHGLSATAASIGSSASIVMPNGWTQYPIMWTAVVAPPSATKSSGLSEAIRPIQHSDNQKHEKARAEWDALEKAQRRGKFFRYPHTLASDITLQRLGTDLYNNLGGILLARDELAGWVKSFNEFKSGKGSDRENYLSLWTPAPTPIHRQNADDILIEHPILSITGTIHPDQMALLGGTDGMPGRFLVSYLDDRVAPMSDWSDVHAGRDDWAALLAHLMSRDEVGREIANEQTEYFVRREDPAFRQFYDFQAKVHAAKAASESQTMTEYYGKMQAHVVRFALILHVCEQPTRRFISEDEMERAITLYRYFAQEALNNQTPEADPTIPAYAKPLDDKIDQAARWLKNHPEVTWSKIQKNKLFGCRTGKGFADFHDRFEALYPNQVELGGLRH
jgi:hypothetical protein